MLELLLCFENRAALLAEYDKNLAHGRAFVPGEDRLPVFSPCVLVIEHPESHARERFACEVVMVLQQGEQQGTAVQFSDRSDVTLERLRTLVHGRAPQRMKLSPAFDDESTGVLRISSEPRAPSVESAGDDNPPHSPHDAGSDPVAEDPPLDDTFEDLDDEQTNPFGGAPEDAHERTQKHNLAAARAQKLRNLTPPERMQVARGSVPEDRVLLERIYGSAVWELLLRNPKITIPEVARMARKGTLPRPLLDLIAENEQWIRHSLVRRALLSNPRLSHDSATRVLRTLPPRELKLVPQQTAYPLAVRQVAARLMRGS